MMAQKRPDCGRGVFSILTSGATENNLFCSGKKENPPAGKEKDLLRQQARAE